MKPTSPLPTAGMPPPGTAQLSDTADPAVHVAANTAGPPVAVDDGSPRTASRKGDGGMRARLNKMFDTKAVPQEPALQFDEDWQNVAAAQIRDHWIESRRASNPDSVSLVALSRMKALDYERKHRDSIPEAQRLLSGNPSVQDYYDAQMEAFLNAIGIEGKDLTELLESFKQAGTGGLHRQHVTATATFNGLVGGTAQILSTQHPAASAALYGVRLLLQGLTTKQILDSGSRRLRNAGTEDVLPRGRADASPSAKQAPTMFEASHDVIWALQGVEKNLRKMETAMNMLERAKAIHACSGTDEGRSQVEKARNNLEIAFAKICYQMEVKASYKASSESAKIEFRGNERYLITSYSGASLTLGAGLFSILTPALGVAAAPATGGVSIGAAVLVMLLYAGYQLSSGPGKDGEAKAKRAIVALSKSVDILAGDKASSRGKRAAAYKVYIEEKKAARFKSASAGAEIKEAAKAALLARLEMISREDDRIEAHTDSRQNRDAYCRHLENVSEIRKTAAPEDIDGRIKALERQFQDQHKDNFSMKAVTDAWKTPMSIRMATATRLLRGKVAESQRKLIGLIHHPGLKARVSKGNNDRAIVAARAELRRKLLDMFNLELALHHMRPLVDGIDHDPMAMERARRAIGAIEDEDVRDTFCGDGRAQVEATDKAKKLTAGEAERYTYANVGASAIGIGLNLAVGATDLGLTAAKVSGAVHVGTTGPNPEGKPRIPQFNDYKFAGVSQAGAPLAAHMNAGDRAAFQKTQMPGVLDITRRGNDKPVEFTLNLNDANHLDEGNALVKGALDTLVDKFARADSVPDRLILSLTSSVAGTSRSSGVEMAKIPIDFQTTSGYHRARYRNASRREKLKVAAEKARIVGKHALMSFAGLPAQALAQTNLNGTRAVFKEAAELDKRVRRNLHDVATGIGSMPVHTSSQASLRASSMKPLPALPTDPGKSSPAVSAIPHAVPERYDAMGSGRSSSMSMRSIFRRKSPPIAPPLDPRYQPIHTVIRQAAPAMPSRVASPANSMKKLPALPPDAVTADTPGTPVDARHRDPAPPPTGGKPLPPVPEEEET